MNRLTRSASPFFLALLALLTVLAPAHAQFGNQDPMVDARLVSDRESVAPGDVVHLALHQDITPGWHTYWRNPGDSGEATRLELDLPEGWGVGDMIWPAPNSYPLGPLTNYGYSNAVTLPVPITIPEGTPEGRYQIEANATWLVCEDVCIPEDAQLSITLNVGPTLLDLDGDALISEARAAAPVALTQGYEAGFAEAGEGLVLTLNASDLGEPVRNLELFPVESGILDHAGRQDIVSQIASDSAQVRVDVDRGYLTRASLPGASEFVLSFEREGAGGWSREAVHFVAQPGQSVNTLLPASGASPAAAEPQSLSFFQAALYALIGGLILNLMPCVFPVLSMKALTLVEKRDADRGEARLLGLIFAAGVIVTFLALGALLLTLRVSGLPGLWGLQLQAPVVVMGLALLMFLIGLNFMGVFEIGTSLQNVGSGVRDSGRRGSFLTGVLAVFVAAPCLAPFMAGALAFALVQPPLASLSVFVFLGVGLAAPFVIVSFFPGLLGFLPRPGPWMVRFRQVLAFPMFAAAIWLVWVLVTQVGHDGVIWALGAFLAAGFAVWAFSLKGWSGRISGVAGALLTIGAILVAASPPQDALWEEWSPDAVQQAQAEGRPVFVDFTAAWCVTCQVNKVGALADGDVVTTFLAHDVALFRADFTSQDPIIAEELARHSAPGVPLYLVFPADGGAPEVLPPLLTRSIVIQAVEQSVQEEV